jgi:hypothetical protein
VPANRSRTLQWRRCLEQIQQRNGAIEIAVAREYDESENGAHLIWRVRVLAVGDAELVVEPPAALGRTIPLEDGVQLVAILAVGQNRWMFTTQLLGSKEVSRGGRDARGLRLRMPDSVKRCQRRNHYRVETAAINLPHIEIWPLLDPKSVVLAERMNELQIDGGEEGPPTGAGLDADDMMPEVGPRFAARLLNIGGGGLGMDVEPEHQQILTRHKVFWLRVALPPELDTPICASAKLAHTHMQSNHHLYAGMAFDFTFNAGHQRVVAAQICRYVALQQQRQTRDGVPEARKSA